MRVDRLLALLLALSVCLGAMPWARADTDYPPFQGIVADVADVLSQDAAADLKTLSERLNDLTGGHIYVLTRHFLGGADAQNYAQKVFEIWNLGSMDALLLLVIGEESYALALGAGAKAALPAETQTGLLASQLRTPFLSRQYDAAVGNFAVALGQALAKNTGETLNVRGLFGNAAAPSTPRPHSSSQNWQGMFAQDDYYEEPWNWDNDWQYEETHVNWRGILIWALVIYFLFFRRKKRRWR